MEFPSEHSPIHTYIVVPSHPSTVILAKDIVEEEFREKVYTYMYLAFKTGKVSCLLKRIFKSVSLYN